MSSVLIQPFGTAKIAALAASKIAVFTKGAAQVYQEVGYPNHPVTLSLVTNGNVVNQQTVFSITVASNVFIMAGALPVLYDVGTDPLVEDLLNFQIQTTPGVLNATGALTAAMMVSGIVTSSTAAAVAGTVPVGTVLDAAFLNMQINDSFDWSVIATGASAFTVTAAAGHTIVGTAAVATVTSGQFRTVKTAAATYISYRMG